MKIYLAGPMRGIPYFNFPMFDRVAAALRAKGHEVFNPADNDRSIHGSNFAMDNHTGDLRQAEQTDNFDLRDALRVDLGWIIDRADAVFLLPGWENSKGATTEACLAAALGIEVYEIEIEEDK